MVNENNYKGYIRIGSIEDDEKRCQWSESFSFDVIQSNEMRSCHVNDDRTYLVRYLFFLSLSCCSDYDLGEN